jgi:hypothetical protein
VFATQKRETVSLEAHKGLLRVDITAHIKLVYIVPGTAGLAGVLKFCAPMIGPEAAGA